MVFVEDLETLSSYSLLSCDYCDGQGEVLIVDFLEWPWWEAFPRSIPQFPLSPAPCVGKDER
jgi:hypothetical protein